MKITITITPSTHEKAKKLSEGLLGKVNVSAYIAYLIEKENCKPHGKASPCCG